MDKTAIHGLRLKDVTITLDGRELVSVDHTILPGEILTVMGPSGSGKSTLLAFIGGFLDPAFHAAGEVYCGDINITSIKTQYLRAG